MQQLELDLGERYDIFTDTWRPVEPKDKAVYQATMIAYGRVRVAATQIQGYIPLISALNRIHDELKRRIGT